MWTVVSADSRRSDMFGTRLISGIVLIVALIAIFVFGDPYVTIAFGLLSVCAVYELMRVLKLDKHIYCAMAMTATVILYVLIWFGLLAWSICLLTVFTILLLIVYVLSYPKIRIEAVCEALFATMYAGGLLSYVVFIRNLWQGEWLIWLVVMGSWGADTCAYCVGKLIGKHHFSELSPKKTIEGCVGGVLGAGLIAFGYSFFAPDMEWFLFSPKLVFPLVVMVAAVVSIFGDLAASAIKRNFEVKDYGRIIPGHGGILDRFDSMIFVAPFVYYLLIVSSTISA
ncbi:MAG TPA: phosphatidate cytidylyltransferase [Lachnospiraceae bacterium]|nr:phosphatidate cytidylyltransferase [Lachnospiraceae bacterium]